MCLVAGCSIESEIRTLGHPLMSSTASMGRCRPLPQGHRPDNDTKEPQKMNPGKNPHAVILDHLDLDRTRREHRSLIAHCPRSIDEHRHCSQDSVTIARTQVLHNHLDQFLNPSLHARDPASFHGALLSHADKPHRPSHRFPRPEYYFVDLFSTLLFVFILKCLVLRGSPLHLHRFSSLCSFDLAHIGLISLFLSALKE